MADSKYVIYENYTQNKTTTANKVNHYLVPHVYVGQVTAKRGADHFATPCDASCQYVVGTDGIAQCVPEKDRSWCTGGSLTVNGYTGSKIDYESITFECACDAKAPYALRDDVFERLYTLMADCAIRNNMGILKWKNDKTLVGNWQEQNILVHRWFARKSCPGDWLMTHMDELVYEANRIITGGDVPKKLVAQPTIYFGNKGANVKLLQENLVSLGYTLPRYGCDGDCGNETKGAIMRFQKDYALDVDGIYGPLSYAKMRQVIEGRI